MKRNVNFYVTFLLFLLFRNVMSLEFKYHNKIQLNSYLYDYPQRFPALNPKVYNIGFSENHLPLTTIQITAANLSDPNIPNIKLIGNIHGNEAVGRELLLHFLEHIGTNFATDDRITWLLQRTKIHVLPSMNPDGFENSRVNDCRSSDGRSNANNIDLNRNFPDYFIQNKLPQQAEMKAVVRWMNETPFILSASLHSGAVVANYPFDSSKVKARGPSLSPDNDVFVHLANTYAKNHKVMHKGVNCSSNRSFKGGITNGAEWYRLEGGMQDYNYAFHGCFEVTLEIYCCKYPPVNELRKVWKENSEALIEYCMQALQGITGVVKDSTTGKPIVGANLKISGRYLAFKSYENGAFWRILLPGNYSLEVKASGYHSENISFHVPHHSKNFPKLTQIEVKLQNVSLPTPLRLTVSHNNIESSSPLSTIDPNTMDVPVSTVENYDNQETESFGLKKSAGNELRYFRIFIYIVVLLNICL